MYSSEEIFMHRAFELAQKGLGYVRPNPLVGCVIVYDGKIIGEGYHEQYGQAHAEVNAINSVDDKSLLEKSTAYVTLEPCAHHGKTPPCADLLVQHQLKRVITANKDPYDKVSGQGIERLKQANIKVELGILAEIGENINRRFFTFHKKKRPYIILKWAQTTDGFIARENFDSKWISNEYSRKLVHKWRAEEAAILIGTNTAQYDNPSLNVRDWAGENPLRIVIDKSLRLPKTLNLFDGSIATVCYNLSTNAKYHNLEYVKLDDDSFLDHLLQTLYERNIQSLIVEGGSRLINSFIEKELWDETRVFTSKIAFNKGISAPNMDFSKSIKQSVYGDKLELLFNI